MLFTWFILGGAIFLLAPQSITNKFQFAFARIFNWPLSIGRNISLSVRTRQQPTEGIERRKYIQLRNHIANVEAQLAVELQRNQQLSGFRKKHPLQNARFVFANIVAASTDELVIGCGKEEGLAEGQFVLGDNSIVGVISQASANTAKVRLITSAASQLPIKIGAENAMIVGIGKRLAKIPYFQTKHNVAVGDPVYCRPRPGVLNSPMIVARIAECKEDGEQPLLWNIIAEPACMIKSIDYVDVIVMSDRK